MFKYALLALLIASTRAVPTPDSASLDCLQHDEDVLSCLAVKAVSSLQRAARSADFKIVEGIAFVRDAPMERSGKALKPESELLQDLPRDTADRTLELATMLYESALSFLKTHSLSVNVPEGSVSRALSEGRGKLKKMLLPLLVAAAVKIFALAPLLLGGLALLVVKALFVGKIALLIVGILAFQRLFSGGAASVGSPFAGGFFGKSPQASYYDNNQAGGWSTGAQSQGYYRSFNDKADQAQELAYAAHLPAADNEAN